MEVITNIIWRKYTNPWSIWVRFLILPMIVLSMWSRIWIEQWSFLLIILTFAWIWFNPRISPNKKSNNIWAMQAILGERIWLNRSNIIIPEHHFFIITVLHIMIIISFLICIAGGVLLNKWLTLFGLAFTYISMCWFLDRMVWLYNDNKLLRKKNKIKLLKLRKRRQQQILKQKMQQQRIHQQRMQKRIQHKKISI